MINSLVRTGTNMGHIKYIFKKMNRKVTLSQSSDNKQKENLASYSLCTIL